MVAGGLVDSLSLIGQRVVLSLDALVVRLSGSLELTVFAYKVFVRYLATVAGVVLLLIQGNVWVYARRGCVDGQIVQSLLLGLEFIPLLGYVPARFK